MLLVEHIKYELASIELGLVLSALKKRKLRMSSVLFIIKQHKKTTHLPFR